jgi:chromosomal replication initiator protein
MAGGISDVLDVVAGHFDVCVDDIKSQRRSRQVVPARLVSAYLAERILGLTMQEIGDQLGGRDQTNIVMYCRTVARRADEDEAFRQLLYLLEARCLAKSGWA